MQQGLKEQLVGVVVLGHREQEDLLGLLVIKGQLEHREQLVVVVVLAHRELKVRVVQLELKEQLVVLE